jgi:endoglucanase
MSTEVSADAASASWILGEVHRIDRLLRSRRVGRVAALFASVFLAACSGASGSPASPDGGVHHPDASAGADGASVDGVADAADGGDVVTVDAGRDGAEPDGSAPLSGLHASGNKIVDATGQTVSLRGVDLNGTEYKCAQGQAIFDSPLTMPAVSAMLGWKINAVRIGLNEDCWLGINGVDATYSGANYQTPFEDAVNLLTTNGLVVIIELHWSSTGTALALGQEPMPTATSLEMWQQVAAAFKGNGLVVFDLYNEPILLQGMTDKAGNSWQGIPEAQAWDCWKNGQSSTNTCGGFPAVGMQAIVNAVRAVGASNLIMLGGLNYGNDLTQWPASVPADAAKNLAASFHGYGDGTNQYFVVGTQSMDPTANVNSMLGAVLGAGYPVVIGEFGSSSSGSGAFAQADLMSLMTWADTNDVGYLAFSWVHYGIALVDLIVDYTSFSATPQWGTFYRSWLATH